MMNRLQLHKPRLLAALFLALAAATVATSASIGTGSATGANTTAPGLKAEALSGAVSKISLLNRNVATDAVMTETEVDNSPIDPEGDVIDTKHIVRPAIAAGARAKLGGGLIVAPTRNGDGLCTVGAGRMACAEADDITTRGGVFSVSWRGDGVTALTGLALDSVKSVSVTYEDGSTATVPVEGNIANAALDQRPKSISWVGPAGKQVALIAQDPSPAK